MGNNLNESLKLVLIIGHDEYVVGYAINRDLTSIVLQLQFLQERQRRFGEQWLSSGAKNEAVLSAKAEPQLILLRSCFGEPAGHKQHICSFFL